MTARACGTGSRSCCSTRSDGQEADDDGEYGRAQLAGLAARLPSYGRMEANVNWRQFAARQQAWVTWKGASSARPLECSEAFWDPGVARELGFGASASGGE